MFEEQEVINIIGAKKGRLLIAYNLCDGTSTQQEIARKLKIDVGNFSRTVGRRVVEGILFRIPKGDQTLLLHVFPVKLGKKTGWPSG